MNAPKTNENEIKYIFGGVGERRKGENECTCHAWKDCLGKQGIQTFLIGIERPLCEL